MLRRTLVVLLIGLSLGTFFTTQARANFPDVPIDHWAYDALEYLQEEGLVVGYPDGNFYGNQPMSRYELAMVVSRIYQQLMDMIEQGMEPSIDIEAVLQMLMDEFQPEIDELYAMVASNTERIEALEGSAAACDEYMAQLNERIDQMQVKVHPYGDLTMWFNGTYPEGGGQTQRPQFQFNFGFTTELDEGLTLGARMASAGQGAAQSKWQAYDHAFATFGLQLDRAYLMWQPSYSPGFTMWIGKFYPPWRHTYMTWESDLQAEGLAQNYTWNDFNFYLAELVPTEKGFYLVAQIGYNNLFTDGLNVAATYHFINEDAWELLSANMATGALYNGGWTPSRLESPTDYRAIELYAEYSGEVGDVPFKLVGNCLMNLEDSAPGLEDESGWQRAAFVTLDIMKPPTEVGDWNVWGEWGRLQPNSVLPWTTETWRGTGDTEFWVVGWRYRIMRNTTFWVSYIDRERISRISNSEGILVAITSSFK